MGTSSNQSYDRGYVFGDQQRYFYNTYLAKPSPNNHRHGFDSCNSRDIRHYITWFDFSYHIRW